MGNANSCHSTLKVASLVLLLYFSKIRMWHVIFTATFSSACCSRIRGLQALQDGWAQAVGWSLFHLLLAWVGRRVGGREVCQGFVTLPSALPVLSYGASPEFLFPYYHLKPFPSSVPHRACSPADWSAPTARAPSLHPQFGLSFGGGRLPMTPLRTSVGDDCTAPPPVEKRSPPGPGPAALESCG